jgi:hypothetical protein
VKTLGSTLPRNLIIKHIDCRGFNKSDDSHSGGKACTAVNVESVSLGVESRDNCSASLKKSTIYYF